MIEQVVDITRRLAGHLTGRADQLRCFNEYASQVEGWFKGELLWFLDEEKKAGHVLGVEREKLVRVGVKRVSVDFLLDLQAPSGSALCWTEIKHWHIGKQNGSYFGSKWYFRTQRHSACVRPDIEKLAKIPDDGARTMLRTMLILCTKNPGSQEWNEGIRIFNERNAPLRVHSLTTPEDYPEYFFLGLLDSRGGTA